LREFPSVTSGRGASKRGEYGQFQHGAQAVGAVTIVIGLLHISIALHADASLGARLPAEVLGDPVLDSQNRFFGACFAGYGALLLLCASDVRRYASVLNVVVSFVALGGVARLISIALYGVPAPQVIGLTVIELVAPLLLLWQRRVLAASATGS
jgi:hypothetical protein